MIIAEIELRQPHHYLGQLRHAYRHRDGFEITVEGSMVLVRNLETGRGVLFPVTDVLTARTEPDRLPLPEGVASKDDETTRPAAKKPTRERA